jgi:hypothetical protein
MDEEGCDCEKCKEHNERLLNVKRKYRLEGINLVEQKIEENLKKTLYTMGIPKAKILDAINRAKEEVK